MGGAAEGYCALCCWIRGLGRGGGVGTFLSAFGSWAEAGGGGGAFLVLRFGVGERGCLAGYEE